jgi:hypothetical protein
LQAPELELCPVSLADANDFVANHHRHHKPLSFHKFSVGCASAGSLVGVAIVGRPVSRNLDDGQTLEVSRLCTDGTKNACSMLYNAAWRAAKAIGYKKIITYILDSENGASLKAAGWNKEADVKYQSWDRPGRRRNTDAPICDKQRWSKTVPGVGTLNIKEDKT